MKTSLPPHAPGALIARLHAANAAFAASHPAECGVRQPVHTVYGGAHLFKADTSRKLGARALRELSAWAPEPGTFARALGIAEHAETVYHRVIEKLEREPVEDFRIDFEDGYGARTDAEEDGHAVSVAAEVAVGAATGTLPPFLGIRIKPLTEEAWQRGIRTLDLLLTALAERADGRLPRPFLITLPKVTVPEQVAVLAEVLHELEQRLPLAGGALQLELMAETPSAILNLRALVEAAAGRCFAVHFGAYDYTASCGLTAAHQDLLHPVCDFARHMMQASLAGTSVNLSDGVTNILPIPPHRRAEGASPLTDRQNAENRETVHRAWALHYRHVRHSLANGFYQSWDVHPAQLPVRYAAVDAFFLEGMADASTRLRNFMEKAAQATRIGELFDDAATGQGLLNYFLRALNCGAVSEAEVRELTGLTPDELRSASFLKIMRARHRSAAADREQS